MKDSSDTIRNRASDLARTTVPQPTAKSSAPNKQGIQVTKHDTYIL